MLGKTHPSLEGIFDTLPFLRIFRLFVAKDLSHVWLFFLCQNIQMRRVYLSDIQLANSPEPLER